MGLHFEITKHFLDEPGQRAGSIRLAAPTSPWARRRYPVDGRKMVRSRARFERVRSRRRRVLNAIGGAPSPPV